MAKKKITVDVMVNDRFYKTIRVVVESVLRWFDDDLRDIVDPDDIEKAVLAELPSLKSKKYNIRVCL